MKEDSMYEALDVMVTPRVIGEGHSGCQHVCVIEGDEFGHHDGPHVCALCGDEGLS